MFQNGYNLVHLPKVSDVPFKYISFVAASGATSRASKTFTVRDELLRGLNLQQLHSNYSNSRLYIYQS